ncbi:aldose 1-epimerase [soil metagenome]
MLTLRAGKSSATIHPALGGRIGQLDLGDGPLLRGPSAELGWGHWGCYPLLPWSNRIPGGHLRYGSLVADLPVNWPDGSAIHGLAASRPWTVLDRSAVTAEMEVLAIEGPYRVRGSQRLALEADRLTLRLQATNEADEAVPVGIGIHPWFRSGPVRLAADQRWPGSPLPTGAPVPVDGPYDLRQRRTPDPMNVCFTALTATVAEVPGARLHWDGPVTDVVVYTGEPGFTCVEPVTMANGAFALPPEQAVAHGVQWLAPGASIAVQYRFERNPECRPAAKETPP